MRNKGQRRMSSANSRSVVGWKKRNWLPMDDDQSFFTCIANVVCTNARQVFMIIKDESVKISVSVRLCVCECLWYYGASLTHQQTTNQPTSCVYRTRTRLQCRVYYSYNLYWVMLACVSHIKCSARCKFASFMCWTFWRDGNVIILTLAQ